MAQQPFSFPFTAMASRCEVRLFAPGEQAAQRWADAAIAEVRRIEAKYSRYRTDSVTSAINQAAGGAPVDVDDETAGLIAFGAQLYDDSEGLFDLTSGVLRRAWDFKAARLPSRGAVDELLPLVGWSKVRWDGRSIALSTAGMEVDFGGIGKEYAADRAAAIIADLGAAHGLVNLGGDTRVVGPQLDGAPWRIAVQDPRGDPGATIAYMNVPQGAMATSGDYERYFEHQGQRYSHLLDPRTGWPAQHWRSVSVVAPLCIAAGACATVAMLKPAKEALSFLDGQGFRYLAIDSLGQCYSK